MKKFNIYDLKMVVDRMVNNHKEGKNPMSESVNIIVDDDAVYFRQICQYQECNPNVHAIKSIG